MRTSFVIDAFEPHEARLSKSRWLKHVYLTKRPSDIYDVAPRLKLDPRLIVICMMRDPRDVIVSKHGKAPDHFYTSLKIWKERARYIRQLKSHPRFLLLRYEDLVSDPDASQNLIAARFPMLNQRDYFSAFGKVAAPISKLSHEALGGLRTVSRDSIGNWRQNKARVVGQIQLHGSIESELIEFGYETDVKWLNELVGIQPDFSPSYSELQPRKTPLQLLTRALKSRIHAVVAGANWLLCIPRI